MKSAAMPYHLCLEVLGNPLRIKIIKALGESPKSVMQLAKETGEEQSKVSHSLSALRKCEFVSAKRHGKEIVYSLRDTFLKKIKSKNLFEALEKHFKAHGAECWRCCE